MSDRTVAEIIGKTADGHWPHDGRGCPPGWDVFAWKCGACGEWVDELQSRRTSCPVDWRNATPTVDVMLAWLKERDAFAALVTTGTQATVEYIHPDGWHGFKRAEALHAALSAAVLSVAE